MVNVNVALATKDSRGNGYRNVTIVVTTLGRLLVAGFENTFPTRNHKVETHYLQPLFGDETSFSA